MLQVFGIKNCNTVKKALSWLDGKKISYEFLDVKKNTLQQESMEAWVEDMPDNYSRDRLVNKSGITWRNLSEKEKTMGLNPKTAIELILQKPSVMKRPVIIKNKKVIIIGYDETEFETNLND